MKQHSTARMNRKEAVTSAVLVIIYSVGVAGISIGYTRELFTRLIPAVLILSLATSLAFHGKSFDLKTIMVFLAVVLISWTVEAAGVATGKIFGSYSYGSSLGTKILDTPLIIGINWLLLVYGSSGLVRIFNLQSAIEPAAAALMMVAYDLVLERVAPSLEMWQFEGGTAPFRNYLAWFVLALLFHLAVKASGIRIVNHVAAAVFVVQFMFFVAIMLISSLP